VAKTFSYLKMITYDLINSIQYFKRRKLKRRDNKYKNSRNNLNYQEFNDTKRNRLGNRRVTTFQDGHFFFYLSRSHK
jgi:hypothetical protein